MSTEKSPEIIVFAGPNGSGKSTVTKMAKVIEPYINADEIKRTNHCTDLEAAVTAEKLRNEAVDNGVSFRTCLHNPVARLCGNLLPLPSSKRLEIRKYSCVFFPSHRQNLAANPHTGLVKTGSKSEKALALLTFKRGIFV